MSGARCIWASPMGSKATRAGGGFCRRLLRHSAAVVGIVFMHAAAAYAQTPPPALNAPELTAQTMRTYDAPEADQGVAVDASHFYAIDNFTIAKYRRDTGARVTIWQGVKDGPIRHLNSCLIERRAIVCANSNYPETPMGSSVEVFDARTLAHQRSYSLGLREEGSLTWTDRIAGGFIAGFAHYDEDRGAAFKDHRHSSVVTFDEQWRRTGGWLFPSDVAARMAPHAASGGAIGPDGYLYILGHDRPEMYVLARPKMGPRLVHLATIALEAEGQAFSFAPGPNRHIFAIDRRKGQVREIALPAVVAGADGLTFQQ